MWVEWLKEVVYHFTVAGPWRAVCFACQTILDAHAETDRQGDKRVERDAAHVSVRILRSRGSGTLTPPSEGEVAGRGGSGSKPRGRTPGSRKAYVRGMVDDLRTKEVQCAYCGKHARDGEEAHVSSYGGDGGRFIEPPPDTGGGKPGG